MHDGFVVHCLSCTTDSPYSNYFDLILFVLLGALDISVTEKCTLNGYKF